MQTTARTNIVHFRGQDITIRELSLRKIGALAEIMEGLANQFDKEALESEDMQRIVPAVSHLIQSAPDKIVALVKLGADVTDDDILDATPRELMDLFIHIWQINNLAEMFQKKVQSLLPSGQKA